MSGSGFDVSTSSMLVVADRAAGCYRHAALGLSVGCLVGTGTVYGT